MNFMPQNKPKSYNLILQIFFTPIIYAFISVKLFSPTSVFVLFVMLACVIYCTFRQAQIQKRIRPIIKSIFISLFTVILSFIFVRAFIFTPYFVTSIGMIPSLQERDRVIADQTSYLLKPPIRGDIVVLKYQGSQYVMLSRIVGLPKEKIEIKQGEIYINNQQLQENYLSGFSIKKEENYPPMLIDFDKYFVLLDYRDMSFSDHKLETISRREILGKITGRFYPFNKFGVFESPEYKTK